MRPVVLNVEDSVDDTLLLQHAWRSALVCFDIQFVADGELAIDYLAGRGAYGDRTRHPLPVLILLDLNMPRKGGLEVLDWIKAEPSLRHIPVAIFTSSSNGQDVQAAFKRGADSYLAKPMSYEALLRIIGRVDKALTDSSLPIARALEELPEHCRLGSRA